MMKRPATALAFFGFCLAFVSCSSGGNPDVTTTGVPVVGISLNRNSMALAVGSATGTLVPAIAPANATNKHVTWVSGNSDIADVSTSGVVTPKTVGTSTITVISSDGGFKAECRLEVTSAPIPAIAAAPTHCLTSTPTGAKGAFIATFAPANATNQNVN
jgi:uncharacterized protein YjdB